ncbi:hypothetical protein Taro_054080 [Colocasia esculenta]|uniref:Retrotransposon gag domain-containing protein n=1 Tax=Colocasia esculenta TaxID=4460 RepID=A0A843XMZ0_COLES|nr:hypothetical protein [Colocasia esculenta]
MCATWRALGALSSGRRHPSASRSGGDATMHRVPNRSRFLKNPSRQNSHMFCSAGGGAVEGFSGDFGWRTRFSTRFRCKKIAWSVRIAGEASYRAFFANVGEFSPFRGNNRGKQISEMADIRDWGGGGDDPEENTQRMIERIWESLTDIRRRMDQQAPVPPVAVPPGDGETVHIAPIPPGIEVPFVAPLPPPVLAAEEPVMQVEKFLRLQPPTYSGGPNPDTAEHWVHEIERVFTTKRCPATNKVMLAAYQLRGFALEWWRLKMQTTFAGRTEETITWPEFLDVFNDTFFPIQVQQVFIKACK